MKCFWPFSHGKFGYQNSLLANGLWSNSCQVQAALCDIELTPRELAWLPSLLFVIFIFPARILTGWAMNRALRQEQPRHWFPRWLARLGILPIGLAYVLVVYLTPYLSWNGALSLLEQHAFLQRVVGDVHALDAELEEGGVQCGFCTPGMLLSATALLERNPSPTEEEVRIGLSGNLCRCTGYAKIVTAVQRTAAELRS